MTTLKEKTLSVNGNDADAAWRLLGEFAGYFGDNGGDCDGNGWLPSVALTTEDGVADVIRAGYGEFVYACYYEDMEDVYEQLKIRNAHHGIERDEDGRIEYESLQDALRSAEGDHIEMWSGYLSGATIVIAWNQK